MHELVQKRAAMQVRKMARSVEDRKEVNERHAELTDIEINVKSPMEFA